MLLREAKELAVQLMSEHGLLDQGWHFKFDSARSRAGVCMYRKKVIGLSRYLTKAMSDEKVKDTILHEIAHALVGGRHGHDRVWQAKAIEIGCNGLRCYDVSEVDQSLMPQSKYTMSCPTCGKEAAVHRRPKRRKSCGKCNPHRFDSRHELVLTQNY